MLKRSLVLRFICFSTVLLAFAFTFSTYSSSQSKSDLDEVSQTAQQENQIEQIVDRIPHHLIGSYYTLENATEAKLLLNNKGNARLEVQPTLYNLQGQELQLPVVTVEAQSFRFINLQDWAGIGGDTFRSGSIKLFHFGKDLVLGSQIYLTQQAESLSFEEKLAELGKFDSRRQEAVWAVPSPQASVKVVLTNTTDASLSIAAKLAKSPNKTGAQQIFQLSAHETKVLDLKRDFVDGNQFTSANLVGLSLEHSTAKDALLARVMVSDQSKGFSNVVQFSNPLGGKSSEYQGVGFQIKDVDDRNQHLSPVIAVRNVGNYTTTVSARVPYTRSDGTRGTITLPQKQLSSGEMDLINTQNIAAHVQREQIKVASLEVEYNSAPGSVIVAAHTVSNDGDLVFRVPMWDPLGQRSPTGGYPWRIEDTSVTETYIKNITDEEQDYVAFLLWENGGIYMIGLKPIAGHETINIDVKKLRDEQIPDERGRTIPLDVSSGQLQWTLRRKDTLADDDERSNLALMGRSEQVDTAKGIVNNYACQNCCSGDFVHGYLEASNASETFLPLDAQSSRFYFAVEEQQTCYGYQYGFIEANSVYNATWNTSDSNIATVSSNSTGGNVTGVNAGNVQISATWRRRNSYVYPCTGGGGEGPRFAENQEELECSGKTEGITREGSVNNEKGSRSKEKTPIITSNIAACGTCISRYSNFTANLNLQIKPKILILRDNADITSTPQNFNEQNVIVGQRMNLKAQIIGGTPSTQQWTIPEKAIEKFETLNSAGLPDNSRTPVIGRPAPIPPNKLTSDQVDFIWHSGGDNEAYKQVQYTATVNGISATGTALFNVKKPTVSFTTTKTGVTSIGYDANADGVLFIGNATAGTQGMEFTRGTPTIPSPFSGTFRFVQLINGSRNYTTTTGSTVNRNYNGLDGCYPYTLNQSVAKDNPLAYLSSGGVISQTLSYNASWNLYLMFKPDGTDSDWVPLKRIDWAWHGEANLVPGSSPPQWTKNGLNEPGAPPSVDTSDYPTWSTIAPDQSGDNCAS